MAKRRKSEQLVMTYGTMEEDRPVDAEPITLRKERRKPYVRGPRPAVDVRYRMACVGTVAFVDRDGETIRLPKVAGEWSLAA